ncbi:putative FixW protein [Giardia duodenalis]|uniref:FixW protein n=1 Tax=Giardia intestinalis (strain ATCC 50803 / WB clone C6) TaxID=184922 RepID=A8B3R0_GIAIC|nr:putative FixW protein [Giardia intestinalis]KAE8303218.1 putative FixW protein [Giardia intestinalis]|eukprot:XP_001710287.1 FixW protein, putative [Giardia lamblia ATCC 50803]
MGHWLVDAIKAFVLRIYAVIYAFVMGKKPALGSNHDGATGAQSSPSKKKIGTFDPMASARLPVNLQKLTYINKVSEYQYGQPIMIEKFATWCPPCRAMIPHLSKMAKKYKNVYILSVSDEDEATVRSFASKIPATKDYNLAVDSSGDVKALASRENINGIPHAFIYDGSGALKYSGHPSQCDSILKLLNDSYKAGASHGGDSTFTGASRKL